MGASIDGLAPDVLSCVLRRLDGPSLAAVGCASSHLRSVSSDPSIWRDLCLSTWPSLRHPHLLSLLPMSHYQSLFSAAYPFPCPSLRSAASDPLVLPRELILAVDLHHKGNPIFSKVMELETSSSWFLGSPFRIDTLQEQSSPGEINPSELTLSWMLIDPGSRKAVNVSSRSPVAIDRHWYTGETLVRYGIVMRGLLIGIVVTCGEDGGCVRELSLAVEDGDGIGVSGRESLEVIMVAMEGGRKWRGPGEQETEANRRYEEFVRRRSSRQESKARKECLLELFCTGVGTAMFLAFLSFIAFG